MVAVGAGLGMRRTVEARDEEVTGVSGVIEGIASGGGGVARAEDSEV